MHVASVDEPHFDLVLTTSEPHVRLHEQPRVGLTGAGPHVGAAGHFRLDRDSVRRVVASEPNVEPHASPGQELHLLDVNGARTRPRIHAGAQPPHAPIRKIYVLHDADDAGLFWLGHRPRSGYSESRLPDNRAAPCYKAFVLDELPSLELAATAVAVVLVLRALRLGRSDALVERRARKDSAKARDLVGIAILAGALAYALGVGRASTWFVAACGLAIAAQLAGFYLRARSRTADSPAEAPASDDPEVDVDEEEDVYACPECGHGTLIELSDPSRLMPGLAALGGLTAFVCPSCGALSGHVEQPERIPLGEPHGTKVRKSPSGEDDEALREATEHDG